MKLRKGDFLAACAVIILAIALFSVTFSSSDGNFVEIKKEGKTEYILPLGDDAEILISGCTVRVSSGKVSVVSATCPDKVCEKTGEISKAGEIIVCLPNRVEVSVVGESMYDAIAG